VFAFTPSPQPQSLAPPKQITPDENAVMEARQAALSPVTCALDCCFHSCQVQRVGQRPSLCVSQHSTHGHGHVNGL
jgi:hypothetical protein